MGISALLASQILDASATGRSVITGADASAIRTTLGLGTLATQSPTGTPSASTFLRGDYSWQTIDLSGYLQLTGGTMTGQLTITQGTANTSVLASTGYSLTGSNAQSLIDVAGTWNTTGTPTLIKANVTDTASNANSLLLDLQVGGSSKFKVGKGGRVTLPEYIVSSGSNDIIAGYDGSGYFFGCGLGAGTTPSFIGTNTSTNVFATGITGQLYLRGKKLAFRVSDAGSGQLLQAESSTALSLLDSTNAQTFRVYNTFTDSSNYERGKIAWESNVLRIGTEKAGTGSARALELQTDGTTRLTIGTTSGTIASLTNLFIDVTTYFASTTLANSRVAIGNGVTVGSAFQFLFSSTTGANGTADTGLARSAAGKVVITNGSTGSGSLVFRDAGDMEFGTTTGTKIGTATTQKLGFYNATPVVQPTAVADATDAASVITQLNALLSRMRDLGLIAT